MKGIHSTNAHNITYDYVMLCAFVEHIPTICTRCVCVCMCAHACICVCVWAAACVYCNRALQGHAQNTHIYRRGATENALPDNHKQVTIYLLASH